MWSSIAVVQKGSPVDEHCRTWLLLLFATRSVCQHLLLLYCQWPRNNSLKRTTVNDSEFCIELTQDDNATFGEVRVSSQPAKIH
ncbi:hypothetical protein VTO42DRAFT_6547 [Malbranchea cinnamomea]